jgi:hypothetical protein
MILTTYTQVSAPGTPQIWTGLFDTEDSPPVSFKLNEAPATSPIPPGTTFKVEAADTSNLEDLTMLVHFTVS